MPTLLGESDSAGAKRANLAIPGYEILGELGRGGMGVVYKARQVRLDRPVALKMILAGDHAGAEVAARFLAEADAVAQLQHPHIVQIYQIGEHDGLPFFALEYVDGGSLAGSSTAPRAAARGRPAGRDLAGGHRRGAPAGHRPSRPQAGQRAAHGRRRAQDRRLRPGQAAGTPTRG